MLIDVFSERGFHATVDLMRTDVPPPREFGNGRNRVHPKEDRRHHSPIKGSEIRRG